MDEQLSSGENSKDNQQAMADEWAKSMAAEETTSDETLKQSELEAGEKLSEKIREKVEDLELEDFSGSASSSNDNLELDVVLDIPVLISMEVGNTKIAIRNLLQLTQGSVIELDRLAGEPLDVLVNGTLIAHGEVVVVNEKFGIRMTDVVSPSERIKKLR